MSLLLDGNDYLDISAQAFVFDPSISSFSVNVPLINDNIFELTESLQAGLSFLGPPPPRATIDPAQADIQILDDDGKVQFILH